MITSLEAECDMKRKITPLRIIKIMRHHLLDNEDKSNWESVEKGAIQAYKNDILWNKRIDELKKYGHSDIEL